MAESQKKNASRGTLQVPFELSQEIVIAAKQWRTTTHELVRAAWELLKEKQTADSRAHRTSLVNLATGGSPTDLVLEPDRVNAQATPIRHQGKVNERWQSAHSQLDGILNSGDEDVKNALLSNLSLFSRIITTGSNERQRPAVPQLPGPDIIEQAASALANADRALGKTVTSPEELERNRPDNKRDKSRNPGKREAAGGGSGD